MDLSKLSSHTYRLYEAELEAVKSGFMEMAGLVESQIQDALVAIDTLDVDTARHIVEKEADVDAMEVKLEQDCVQIIALRAPTASDLRNLLASIRCLGQLERVGDEATKVAKLVLAIAALDTGADNNRSLNNQLQAAHHLGGWVAKAFQGAIDAFARMDTDRALETIEDDEQIDDHYARAIANIADHMKADSTQVDAGVNMVMMLRSLERIGDHAKNICEAVVYVSTGKDIRHGNDS